VDNGVYFSAVGVHVGNAFREGSVPVLIEQEGAGQHTWKKND
jgi:hypothetical protein